MDIGCCVWMSRFAMTMRRRGLSLSQ